MCVQNAKSSQKMERVGLVQMTLGQMLLGELALRMNVMMYVRFFLKMEHVNYVSLLQKLMMMEEFVNMIHVKSIKR